MMTEIKRGGYSYSVTNEQIRKWQAVPPESRLEWLEELNCFLHKAQSLKTRQTWQQFRRGEI